jgi:hypothetical protein
MNTYAPDLSDAEIERQTALADQVVTKVMNKLPQQCDRLNVDVDFVVFGLFVFTVQMLAQSGWTVEQLAKDMQHHHAIGSSDGVG